MAFTWKNFKEKILGQKGLLFIGLADIVGTGITSLFWLYIASIFDPAEYFTSNTNNYLNGRHFHN